SPEHPARAPTPAIPIAAVDSRSWRRVGTGAEPFVRVRRGGRGSMISSRAPIPPSTASISASVSRSRSVGAFHRVAAPGRSACDNGGAPRGRCPQLSRRTEAPDGQRRTDRGDAGPSRGHRRSRGTTRPGPHPAAPCRRRGPARPRRARPQASRPDPLVRRAGAGDRRAAAALVDVLGPRIHGLAVHVTGSSARAEGLAVTVLRSCLRDAGQLATSGLPGEAAVLDRARRAAVATHPTGDVRSLAGPAPVADRTSDRREVDVLRVLLERPPAQPALVESAAQGRFP